MLQYWKEENLEQECLKFFFTLLFDMISSIVFEFVLLKEGAVASFWYYLTAQELA